MPNELMMRISTPEQEGVMRVSKWLKTQVLLDASEMRELFAKLSRFQIYVVSAPSSLEKASIGPEDFLTLYERYVQGLKEGNLCDEGEIRPYFSSIFTTSSDILYAQDVGKDRVLIRALKPVIQLQAHNLFASSVDGKIHPMVLGQESISWGIQFSYPQIFQSPKSQAFSKVADSEEFPNTALFLELMRALRQISRPTPFIFQGKKSYSPIRLGKNCFSWINSHPQLRSRKVAVEVLGD